jgi:phosphatidylserine decarboxylase
MIHKEAFRFLLPLGISAALAFVLGLYPASVAVLLLAAFVAYFFRNPRREIPQDPSIVVSPADGKVVRIQQEGDSKRLSIFLSILDVHVNRSPIAGRIEKIEYKRGSFKAAFNHAASVENERNIITVNDGRIRLEFTQIAGVIARRIVFWKKVGDRVEKGELVGLIRFGSRMDVVFPPGIEITVKRGDRVKGGATPIASIQIQGPKK